MMGPIELGREFCEMLVRVDEAIVERAAAEACSHCGGPLNRGDCGAHQALGKRQWRQLPLPAKPHAPTLHEPTVA
jgi:hypothetical protein